MTSTDFFLQLKMSTYQNEIIKILKPNWISLSAPASEGGVGGAIASSNFFGLTDAAHWYDFRFLSLSGFFMLDFKELNIWGQ